MSLFINCQWPSHPNASLDFRFKRLANTLYHPAVAALSGSDWYQLARSKQQALTQHVSAEAIRQPAHWKPSRPGAGPVTYRVSLWNGRNDPAAVTIMAELHGAANEIDSFVLEGPELSDLQSQGIAWELILGCGQTIAKELGGLALLSSHELIEFAQTTGLQRPDLAAYAAFWGGNDNSNPSNLSNEATEEIVASNWDEAQQPAEHKLQQLIDLLTVVYDS